MRSRVIGTATAAFLAFGPAAGADPVAIIRAQAWTLLDEGPLEDATIVIEDGRVLSVAAAVSPPANARVIDARGRPVTPGLVNGATQLGLFESHGADETVDYTAKPGTPGTPGMGFDVQYAFNPNAAPIQLARADGLAAAVSYPGGSAVQPFSGLAALIRLDEDGARVLRPRVGLFVAVGGASAATGIGSRAAQWQLIRAALDAAQAPSPSESQTADSRVLQLIIAGKLPVAIRAQRATDVLQAVSLKRDYGIQIILVGGAEAWQHADELAAADVPVVLDPYVNLPMSFDEAGARIDNAALLQRAGVRIALATGGIHSYNAGSSLREGAGIAVANGLPYIEGLRAITLSPARIWGVEQCLGTIAPGCPADIVLWDGDPLEPTTLPTAVFLTGREVSLRTRQSELLDRYRQDAAVAGETRSP